jgi:hypothetical protein
VVGAQRPLAVGERPLKQPDRLGRPPRSQAAHREFVLRPNSVRVGGARYPLKQRGPNSNQRSSNATQTYEIYTRTYYPGRLWLSGRAPSFTPGQSLARRRAGGFGTYRWSRSIAQSAACCRACSCRVWLL